MCDHTAATANPPFTCLYWLIRLTFFDPNCGSPSYSLQHVLNGAIGDGAATSVRGQEGGTEGWLTAPNANGSHCALAFVCNTGGIVGAVIGRLAVDG